MAGFQPTRGDTAMSANTERLIWMYEKMIEIREYEETMARVYLEGKLPPAIQKGLAFDIGIGAGEGAWERWAPFVP
jgi:pyruvate dehydrogenase E1 component alpha subunit